MMNEPVHTIMTTEIISVAPSESLSSVRNTFMNNALHHLPVVDNGKLVGIMTTYDLWKNKIAPEDYATTSVKEIMNTKIAKISPSDKIGTAAEVFLSNKFHALPVVDESQKLLGLVTSFDVLLYQFKREYPKPILFKDLYEKQDGRQRATSNNTEYRYAMR